jgi:hypothetical protein
MVLLLGLIAGGSKSSETQGGTGTSSQDGFGGQEHLRSPPPGFESSQHPRRSAADNQDLGRYPLDLQVSSLPKPGGINFVHFSMEMKNTTFSSYLSLISTVYKAGS